MKSIIISSSGLKNISLNRFDEEDDLILVFGQQEIRMNFFFAEFISPHISKLYHSDPTIKKINFCDIFTDKQNEFNEFMQDILTSEIISLLFQLSSGFSIDIDDSQAFKLRFLSIILGNEELFTKLNEVYPPEFNDINLDMYLKYIKCCYHFSQFYSDFDFTSLINYISNSFYLIDETEFLKLPRKIQYAIISNPHLKIKSEDSLFDIISQIIDNKEDDEEIDDISFLEQIEFTGLSEDKLRFFLTKFDFNDMTNSLWVKLFECFVIHFDQKVNRIGFNLHSIGSRTFEFNENNQNQPNNSPSNRKIWWKYR